MARRPFSSEDHEYMAHHDNWGWRARIGMFIVGGEVVPEAEWWAMVPPDVSVHAARITARTPWAAWSDDRSRVELADDLARGAAQFAAMRLSAVVIGHSSSSIVGGKDWDEAVVALLSGILPEDAFVTTNGLDCVAALRVSEVERPFLVMPPWFDGETAAAGVRYLEDHEFEPSGHLRWDPGRKWRDLAPGELYPNGLGLEQDVEALYRQVRAACPRDADGVLMAGTGVRCVGIIDALEQDLARPVLTANQASLWHCLRRSGVGSRVTGYGRLLGL
jgi:maleate isomerase